MPSLFFIYSWEKYLNIESTLTNRLANRNFF
ncbi:hypothetical protein HNQ92_000202 [Rhabdobacter roseus]|uniref:Uncharacterized protein n=1 Tax=Rhabdobacter roseus TaxID=1655419 RepID=A0A840TFW5_9BACT|nr:hypothetical protein [Rhabdobacter roseus]